MRFCEIKFEKKIINIKKLSVTLRNFIDWQNFVIIFLE